VVRVFVADEQRAALVTHLLRVADTAGRQAMATTMASQADAWHDLTLQLGLPQLGLPQLGLPQKASRGIAPERIALQVHGKVLIVCDDTASAAGAIVRRDVLELAEDPEHELLLITLTSGDRREAMMARASGEPYRTLFVGQLDDADKHVWWQTVIQSEPFWQAKHGGDLTQLEHWWAGVQGRGEVSLPRLQRASRMARGTWHMLYAAHYSLPACAVDPIVAAVRQAGDASRAGDDRSPEAVVAELVELGLLEVRDGRVIVRGDATTSGATPGALSPSAALSLCEVLSGIDEGWAQMRASELCMSAMAATPDKQAVIGRAEQLALAAVSSSDDRASRDDYWRRWIGAMDDMRRGQQSRRAKNSRCVSAVPNAP
jgi:hypothetical protein